MDYIPYIRNYDVLREGMKHDLNYRKRTRITEDNKTSLGYPLYKRINVQVIMTQECPYNCSWCIERKNPMEGKQDFDAQLLALQDVLYEHPCARVSITGGEPSLYIDHVEELIRTYRYMSKNEFICVNTTGFDNSINHVDAKINLSTNEYVKWNNYLMFPGATYQTVLDEKRMNLEYIQDIMENMSFEHGIEEFSFRFLGGTEKKNYSVNVWNELRLHPDFDIKTFRVGDFFVYATFSYKELKGRITLGDMWQQKQNKYDKGYSNIIIHPDGTVNTNWR